MIIDAGTILSFSGGEYSDKWTSGPFVVLKDFDQKDVANGYLNDFEPKDDWDEPDEQGFIAWMCANEFIQDVERSFNWYVGAYGEFTPLIEVEPE